MKLATQRKTNSASVDYSCNKLVSLSYCETRLNNWALSLTFSISGTLERSVQMNTHWLHLTE